MENTHILGHLLPCMRGVHGWAKQTPRPLGRWGISTHPGQGQDHMPTQEQRCGCEASPQRSTLVPISDSAEPVHCFCLNQVKSPGRSPKPASSFAETSCSRLEFKLSPETQGSLDHPNAYPRWLPWRAAWPPSSCVPAPFLTVL